MESLILQMDIPELYLAAHILHTTDLCYAAKLHRRPRQYELLLQGDYI